MAGLVNRTLLLLLGLPLLAAAADPVGDPTRPPEHWLQLEGGVPVDAGGPRLQSVLLPQHGKPLAIISGRTVQLGERFGESRLVHLSEREAVLRGPDGVVRLYLTPGVGKSAAVNAAGNKTRGAAQGKERQ